HLQLEDSEAVPAQPLLRRRLRERIHRGPMDRSEQMFPRLTDGQISRISGIGQRRNISVGEVLFEPGDRNTDLFLVISGGIEVVRPVAGREEPITVLGPGQFTGEINMLSARVTLARARVVTEGSVVAL